MSTFTIAQLTFREASRRWILWAALILGVVFLAVYALGFYFIEQDITNTMSRNETTLISTMHNFLLMAGLYAVNFLSIMMAVLTSVDTLSGEIASGTVHTLVSKPLRRWEIVLGKWLGFAGMLSLYLLLMVGGVMLVVYLISGYIAPNAMRGLLLIWLNVLLMFTISLAGGAVLSTLANGVLVFGLYSVAFIGGWIEQFGSFLQNQTAVNVGIMASLIMPGEALWKRAAYEMEPALLRNFGGFSMFTSPSTPSPAFIVYAALYAAVALGLAVYLFGRRDL